MVTKRTYKRNVNKFAEINSSSFDELVKFVESCCKGKSEKFIDKKLDELCKIVDKFIHLNCDIRDWCEKNDENLGEFCCDVMNNTSEINHDKWSKNNAK